MMEAKRHIKEIYGDNVKPSKYTQFGSKMFCLCILCFTLIPIEIFLREIVISRIEDKAIIKLQAGLAGENDSFIISLANRITDLSELDVLRYTFYLLYLSGDAILATKTAFVGFFGEFILVLLKIAYKEPRPFWTN